MQQILVTDHIHDLEHLAEALRAERERDARATPRAALRATPRGAGTGPRRRLGAWLIGVGEAIAGRSADPVGDCGDAMASPV